MKHKSKSFEKFNEFHNKVEKQVGKCIKVLRSNRGGEYLLDQFKEYLKENEIISQLTPFATPQHNSIAKRRNRTLLDMVRSMMSMSEKQMFISHKKHTQRKINGSTSFVIDSMCYINFRM